MDSEVEMRDLLGHSKDAMSSAEEGVQHRKKRAEPEERLTIGQAFEKMISQGRTKRWQKFTILLLCLIGTIAFGTFIVSVLETKQPQKYEGQGRKPKDDLINDPHQLTSSKEIDNAPQNKGSTPSSNEIDRAPQNAGSKCVDDPNFQLLHDPEKNCDWVRYNHGRACNRLYRKEQKLVREVCPVACDNCFSKDDKEGGTKDETSDNNSDPEIPNVDGIDDKDGHNEAGDESSDSKITIVDGIDDKDVYCEDLSQYQEWYETKITKADGVQYRIVEEMSHDQNAFTQGLTYARGKLFESAGLYGKSTVRILDRSSAEVERKVSMESRFFAEGMTYYKDTLIQITWTSQEGFVYNITNLEKIDTFTFETTKNEGWGITWDRCNDELIVTDGSSNLHFWDPNAREEKRRVSVTRIGGRKAKSLNEIEFWRGRVLANVWHEDVILVINPETGVVEKEYDFSLLWPKLKREKKREDVLNGISISEDPNILYFTGKLWDKMFRIQLLPDL